MRLVTKTKNVLVVLLLAAVVLSVFQPLISPSLAQAQETPPTGEVVIEDTSNSACGIGSGEAFAICISNIVYIFTAGIGSIVAWVASTFFSFAVGLSLQGPTYAVDFVSTGWTVARDIANLFFILILVYIAFVIIVRAETRGTIESLAWVIIIALVINFSFFATRLVVDTGNILAVQFYNQIPGDTTIDDSSTKDLSQNIMNAIGVQKLLGTDAFKNFQEGDPGFVRTVTSLSFIYATVGIMLFILAATLLMVGVKFLFRIVILWLVIIAAPLALMLFAFPSKTTRAYYKKWQDLLLTHTFYPAVFLFIFYILSLFLETMAANDSILSTIFINQGTDEALPNGIMELGRMVADIAIRLGFIVVILYLGLRVSETMSVYGATAARTFSSSVTRRMSGLTYGGSATIMRNTLGRAGAAAANSNFVQTRASRTPPGYLGALAVNPWKDIQKGLARAGTGTYDARNVLPDKVGRKFRKDFNTGWKFGMKEKGEIRYDFGAPGKGRLDQWADRLANKVNTTPPANNAPQAANDNRRPTATIPSTGTQTPPASPATNSGGPSTPPLTGTVIPPTKPAAQTPPGRFEKVLNLSPDEYSVHPASSAGHATPPGISSGVHAQEQAQNERENKEIIRQLKELKAVTKENNESVLRLSHSNSAPIAAIPSLAPPKKEEGPIEVKIAPESIQPIKDALRSLRRETPASPQKETPAVDLGKGGFFRNFPEPPKENK